MRRESLDTSPATSARWAVTLVLPRRATTVIGATLVLVLAPVVSSLIGCPGSTTGDPATPQKPTAEESATLPAPGDSQASGEDLKETEAAVSALFPAVETPFTGDLPELRQRRLVRVLVSYSKSNFFFDRGRARGFEHELLSEYEKFLNTGVRRSDERVKLVFVPLPFDRLLPSLRNGQGDIAAAGLTITPEREQLVAFTAPYVPEVREVVVTSRAERGLHVLDDLAGRRVYVRTASSYVPHLESLSRTLVEAGRPPIDVAEVDRYLVTEDILELVNAGVVAITVADSHIANAWAEVLPDIVVREDLVINSGGSIAWAVRKDNPELLSNLNTFIRKHRKGSLIGNVLFERYFENSKWVKNPLSETEGKKLENLIELFKKYGDRYGFDWMSLAAQAYQESGLDNNKRSRSGAVGIMQLLPSTAADKHVNIKDVDKLENNIHAGAKYLAFLRDNYFSDPNISDDARDHFSWAAYNAGPRKIRELRQAAEHQGFDQNEWFFNVEKVAARVIGRETVDYVANIRKYYVAYKLQYETQRLRQEARKDSGLRSSNP